MHNYSELTQAYKDMLLQDELYQPTTFWRDASLKILAELETYGVESFRSLETALGFFVPSYGIPGNSFTKDQVKELNGWFTSAYPKVVKPALGLNQYLRGDMSALADYRVLKGADNPSRLPYLHNFSESKFGQPLEQFIFDGQYFSRSSLNYLLGLAFLKKHLNSDVLNTILEIGGGFGSLGEILGNSGIPNLRYIDIDIPPTSFVAQQYLSNLFGDNNIATYLKTSTRKFIEIESLPLASVLCSWQIERLQGKIDLFVNFISFQEMEPQVVENYLSHVVRLGARWILLRNMREGKNISKDGEAGVVAPILGDHYLSMLPRYELVDRNVIPFGYQTVDGFHSELLLLRLKE